MIEPLVSTLVFLTDSSASVLFVVCLALVAGIVAPPLQAEPTP